MDRYSRLIAWLKVLLPLAALGLLSTLFLLSRNINPVAAIPFAEAEIKERLLGEQITEPFFSGTTRSGDQVTLSARTVRLGEGHSNRTDDLSVEIGLTSGTNVSLSSEMGSFDVADSELTLQGNVLIATSTGYNLTSETLTTSFDELSVVSPGPVSGKSPIGTLRAGQLRLERQPGNENVHLNFTNGVELLYRPQNLEE